MCAANRDLRLESEHGRFRQDLLYRLDVIRIRVPPLRHRPEDIPVLAHHFWTACSARVGTRATLSHGVLAALARYHWPGNIRELRHVIERMLLAGVGDEITVASLPSDVLEGHEAYLAPAGGKRPTLEDVERRYIELTLHHARGNQTRAAAILGISRKALWEKRKRYGLR